MKIYGVWDEEDRIIPFEANGEMGFVKWFRQGLREFNGKYVIQIDYYDYDSLSINKKEL